MMSQKSRSSSRSAISAITPFDGKCHNLQKNDTQFCANFYRFRDIQILFFYLHQLGIYSMECFSQFYHSTVTVKIYRCLSPIFALALTVSEIDKFYILTSRKQVKVTECNYRDYTFRWQMSKFTHVILHF